MKSALVEFTYQRLGGPLPGRGKSHGIMLKGLEGDHIFEQVRQTGRFYEHDLLQQLDVILDREPGVIIDVGANIGNHAIFFSKVIGSKVICVEPNSLAIELLAGNASLNGVTEHITIIRAAAAERSGTLQLEIGPASNLGMTSVQKQDQKHALIVEAQALDDIVASAKWIRDRDVALIKIDVEGYEIQVLLGALEVIDQHRPIIVIETETLNNLAEIDKTLSPFGYLRLGPFCATPTYIFLPKSSALAPVSDTSANVELIQ